MPSIQIASCLGSITIHRGRIFGHCRNSGWQNCGGWRRIATSKLEWNKLINNPAICDFPPFTPADWPLIIEIIFLNYLFPFLYILLYIFCLWSVQSICWFISSNSSLIGNCWGKLCTKKWRRKNKEYEHKKLA